MPECHIQARSKPPVNAFVTACAAAQRAGAGLAGKVKFTVTRI